MLEGTFVAWDEFFPWGQNVNNDGSVVVVRVKLGVLMLGLHHIGINGACVKPQWNCSYAL